MWHSAAAAVVAAEFVVGGTEVVDESVRLERWSYLEGKRERERE